MYGNRDDFDFDIVHFPFLDDDVPCALLYGVYFSADSFAGASSQVIVFNHRNKVLGAEAIKEGYRYHKLQNKQNKSKFHCRYSEIISNVGFQTRLQEVLLELHRKYHIPVAQPPREGAMRN